MREVALTRALVRGETLRVPARDALDDALRAVKHTHLLRRPVRAGAVEVRVVRAQDGAEEPGVDRERADVAREQLQLRRRLRRVGQRERDEDPDADAVVRRGQPAAERTSGARTSVLGCLRTGDRARSARR
jgi:hypothetical protein